MVHKKEGRGEKRGSLLHTGYGIVANHVLCVLSSCLEAANSYGTGSFAYSSSAGRAERILRMGSWKVLRLRETCSLL